MSAIERILSLISLLNHRPYVTMETIKKTCNIPERTAYRYLNTISEANIPLFYDRTLRAYRLTGGSSIAANDLCIDEVLLIILSLRILSGRVNNEYCRDIERLTQKLTVQQPFPIEEALRMFEHQTEGLTELNDYSALVSSLLINAAITCSRRVRVTVKPSEGEATEVEIADPSLRFHGSWQLAGRKDDRPGGIPLSKIRKVTIN